MPRGRVIGEMPIDPGRRKQLRLQGFADFDDSCRQCTDAHHAAAFRPGRLVVIVGGGWRLVSDQCRTVRIVRFAEMAVSVGMFVNVAFPMNVLRSAVARLVNVNDADLMARVREARRRARPVAQCKREARCQRKANRPRRSTTRPSIASHWSNAQTSSLQSRDWNTVSGGSLRGNRFAAKREHPA